MSRPITIVTEPTIFPLAEMALIPDGTDRLLAWLVKTHPECYPHGDPTTGHAEDALFPHGGREGTETGSRPLTDNEKLVELMGRLCYMSFGDKAGTPTNQKYIANTQRGAIPHRSLMYHPKMTFIISGVSRRLTHELIRHYVGADRDEEGSPSQESTRYVEHPGWFVVHPYMLEHPSGRGERSALATWQWSMQRTYNDYCDFIDLENWAYHTEHGEPPKGLVRKRIYEAASTYLPWSVMTTLGWTTNPAALAKLFVERTDISSDLEFQRLAVAWKAFCCERWPNLFW